MAIVAFTFVLVVGIVLGVYYWFVVRPESDDRLKLMGRLSQQNDKPAAKTAQLERPEERLSNVRAVEAVLSRAKGISGPVERLVTQSGVKMTVGTLLMACAVAACIGYLLVKWLTYYTYLGLAAAPMFGVLPYLYVRMARTRRFSKFEEQFPESIELLARALRAGHAFPTGLQMVAEEIPDPVGAEFKLVYDRQNFGMSLNDALKGLAERVPILDAKFFATAVMTQRETGGNLSEVLDNLAAVIRERFKVKRQTGAWEIDIHAKDPTEVTVVSLTIQPGGHMGWHSHPGPGFVQVTSGTASFYEADDPSCSPTVVGVGQAWLDRGETPHIARNETDAPVTFLVTLFTPPGAQARIDERAPGNCPF